MSAVKRNGKWKARKQITLPDGTKKRIDITTKAINTKAEAERLLREEINLWMTGKHPKQLQASEVPTFAEFAEQYLRVYVEPNNKPATIKLKRNALKHLTACFGQRRLDAITAMQVEEFKRSKIAAALKAKSINNILEVLSNLFRVAKDWQVITVIPSIKKLATEKPPFDFLSEQEAEQLLTHTTPISGDVEEWRTLFLLALNTGLRAGEISALRWSDVNLNQSILTVNQQVTDFGAFGTPKSGKTREVFLPPVLVSALRAHRARTATRGLFVFSGSDGSFIRYKRLMATLSKSCKAAGLRRIGMHVLRHTYASQLVMAGVELMVVKEQLGHSNIRETERYAHLAPDYKRQAVARVAIGAANLKWCSGGVEKTAQAQVAELIKQSA